MIWYICLGLGAAFIMAGLAAFFIMRSRGKHGERYLGGAVFLSAVCVFFPVRLAEESAGFALLLSMSKSMSLFVVDPDVGEILNGLPADLLPFALVLYKALVCFLFLCAPVFTLGIVLSYFSNFFEHFRLLTRSGRDLYVFSELNERSLAIAENIQKADSTRSGKAGIVFCSSNDRDNMNEDLEHSARALKAVLLSCEMDRLRVRAKKRSVTYFEASSNEEENVENTLRLVQSLVDEDSARRLGEEEQKNISVYCYSTDTEAEILLDAQEKGSLRVVLIDEARDAVYEQLIRYPLYANLNPLGQEQGREKIGVLIVGGGKTGTEFLKAAAWCGQMRQFDLEIHMMDIKGDLIREELREECPELIGDEGRGNYKIHIYKANVFGETAEWLLDSFEGINYCVIALGDDEENIRAGIMLRRYFSRKRDADDAIICAYICSESKQNAVWRMSERMRTGEMLYYNIIPFGDRGAGFGRLTDAAFLMEYLGLGVHFYYYGVDGNSDEQYRREAAAGYYKKQGNRRSSIANGLHITYKLWEMGLGILCVPHGEAEKEIFRKYIRPVEFAEEEKNREDYYDLEHERWMAFMRGEGWRLASNGGRSLADIRACYESYAARFKNQNSMLKMHPALVPCHPKEPGEASLQEVSDMMEEVNREKNWEKNCGKSAYNPEYVRTDQRLIEQIGAIVAGEWAGRGGIRIHGTAAEAGECVICRLCDLISYYRALYRQCADRTDAREVLYLREMIRLNCYGVLRTESGQPERAAACEVLADLAEEEQNLSEMEK